MSPTAKQSAISKTSQKVPEVTRVTVPFAHALALPDAIAAGKVLGEKVVAYAFKNQGVQGEYAPDSGQSVENYLAEFEKDYGTQPQITGLVVVRSVDASTSFSSVAAQNLGADKPLYVAPAVRISDELQKRMSAPGSGKSNGLATVSSVDWRPDYTDESVLGAAGQGPFLWESYYWYGDGLQTLPNGIGLEFEINEDNPNVLAPNNVRPDFCGDPFYKYHFWAGNFSGYSWSAVDANGGTASLSDYADYNDLSDTCRTESIAIGVRYPKRLTNPYGYYGLYVQISPPAGWDSSSLFSGNVQAVSDQFCTTPVGSLYALTDCMGVTPIQNVWGGNPAGVYNRSTVALSRQWRIPSKCWSSDEKGLVPPVTYSCNGVDQ